MGSHIQHTSRDAWWTRCVATLGPALAVLLAVLVICGAHLAHSGGSPASAERDGGSGSASVVAGSAERKVAASLHPADGSSGTVCCGSIGAVVRALPTVPVPHLPTVLPGTADLSRPSTSAPRLTALTWDCRAPDLHVLQVQRT
ncbi:hypothetical protein ACQEWB_05240 [Streptomyces sp. CA-249302]|uniref:hypothetical protein n=1 Tax=Streptomyces sp. CA-249302 TaxID=3240058 RepID=UPI003D929C9F